MYMIRIYSTYNGQIDCNKFYNECVCNDLQVNNCQRYN